MLTKFDKRSVTTSLVLFTLFSFAGIFWIISSQNSLLDEYPRIELESEVVGKVISVHPSKSIVRIQLKNQQKLTVPAARNYKYSPSDLNLFIKEGDKIRKPYGSDTFLIYKDDQQFFSIRKIS